MRTPATFPRIARSWPSVFGRPAIARRPSSPRSRWPGVSGSRADSTSTTTSCRRGAPNARPGRRRTGPSRICARSRGNLFFSGFTTTTRTLPTLLPSPSAAVTGRSRTSARSRRWTSNWGASCRHSSSRAGQGAGRHRGRRRSRRGARRARRVPARESSLPGDDARSPAARRAGHRTGVSDTPVSTRRVFHTILDWAGLEKRGQPSRRGAGNRPRRGHEAVRLVRMAAAGDGRPRPAEGDPRRKAGGL